MSRGISPKLPLSYDTSDGYALNKTFEEMIKQNLKMLILTVPGERIMIPDFGVGLIKYIFELEAPETRQRISNDIKKQVSTYMPFVEVRKIVYGPQGDDISSIAALNIKIDFKILPLDLFSSLELSIDA